MNLRTRLALTLLVTALPEKTVDASRVDRIITKLTHVQDELRSAPMGLARIDVRDLLLTLLDGVK